MVYTVKMSSGCSAKICRFDFIEGVSEHCDPKQPQPSGLMYHRSVIFTHLCY